MWKQQDLFRRDMQLRRQYDNHALDAQFARFMATARGHVEMLWLYHHRPNDHRVVVGDKTDLLNLQGHYDVKSKTNPAFTTRHLKWDGHRVRHLTVDMCRVMPSSVEENAKRSMDDASRFRVWLAMRDDLIQLLCNEYKEWRQDVRTIEMRGPVCLSVLHALLTHCENATEVHLATAFPLCREVVEMLARVPRVRSVTLCAYPCASEWVSWSQTVTAKPLPGAWRVWQAQQQQQQREQSKQRPTFRSLLLPWLQRDAQHEVSEETKTDATGTADDTTHQLTHLEVFAAFALGWRDLQDLFAISTVEHLAVRECAVLKDCVRESLVADTFMGARLQTPFRAHGISPEDAFRKDLYSMLLSRAEQRRTGVRGRVPYGSWRAARAPSLLVSNTEMAPSGRESKPLKQEANEYTAHEARLLEVEEEEREEATQ